MNATGAGRRVARGCGLGTLFHAMAARGPGTAMLGRRSPTVLVALVVAASGLVLPGAAHPSGPGTLVDATRTLDGADTYMFSIRTDRSFNVLPGSFFEVSGTYPANASVQDAAAIVGIVRSVSSSCPTAAGTHSCFVGGAFHPIRDDGDVQVATSGPLTFEVQRDPNAAKWGGGTVRVDWQAVTGYQKPAPSDPSVVFRFFASVPGAEQLDVQVHLHINSTSATPVSLTGEVAHAGGFAFVGEDYAPLARAETFPATGMVAGEAVRTLTQDGGALERLYAVEAPSWYGVSVLDLGALFLVTHNTASTGDYGVTLPDGRTGYGGLVQVGGTDPGVAVVGAAAEGPYRFFVNANAGVGPQDLFTAGFLGPVSG